MKDMRVGNGYDVHRLVEGRPLVLGGVEIDHPKGLAGHSDADVLLHAIMDALLGALALGDIGQHFPDDQAAYKDADSRQLLRRVASLIEQKGWHVNNIDSIIVAEKPKLASHLPRMRNRMADDLQINAERISVKATTSEGLGFEGRQEGISARACVTLFE